MKWPILFAAIFLPAFAGAQEASPPAPQPSPVQGPTPIEDPALPMPGDESTGAPILLPESTAIPENKMPAVDKPVEHRLASPVDSSANRLEEVREIAARNPHAMVLLKLAKKAASSKAKRRYLRAYYTTVCGRMRKLEPDLKSAIDAYEEQKTGESAISNSAPSKRRVTVNRSRMQHRASAQLRRHHRYRQYEPPEYEDYPPPPFFYGPPPGW
jgi:hypothetical protein